MKKIYLFLLLSLWVNLVSAQDFLPKFSRFKTIQLDTTNFYFNEVWLKSKDVNQDYALGFTKRAFEKIRLGYLKEASADIDQSIKIDSTISYNYSLKGYIKFSEDSIPVALSFVNKAIMFGDSSAENYYYLGEICMKQNKLAEAVVCYKKCTDINPEFYHAWFKVAIISFLNGDYKKSEKLYKKVIKLNPDYGPAYFNLAILSLYSDSDKTNFYLNKAIEHDTTNAHAYFFRGFLGLFHFGQTNSTLADWGKAVKLEPANIFYLMFRGILNIHKKNYDKGMEELISVVHLSKGKDCTSDFEESEINQRIDDFFSQLNTLCHDSVYFTCHEKGQINEALGSFFNGDHKNANRIYDTLLNGSSLKGIIYFLKGYNQEYLGYPEQAIGCYQNAILQDRFPFESYLRQGYCYTTLNKHQEAINALNTFILGNDNTKFAYRCRGNSYMQNSQYDSAILNYNRFLELDSTETDIYFNRAICYKQTGNLFGAIHNFNIIVTKYNPSDMQSIVLLAECTCLAGDTMQALRLLTGKPEKGFSGLSKGFVQLSYSRSEGFSVDYLGPAGHYLRGILYLHYAKYDSAILDFNFCLRQNNKNVQVFNYRGQAYFFKKKYKNALLDFTSALALDTNDMTARYNRGVVYYYLHKPDLAYNYLKVAESLGHPRAKNFIENYLMKYEENK
jgi:tetratricopeptide (TPR) repeat protein